MAVFHSGGAALTPSAACARGAGARSQYTISKEALVTFNANTTVCYRDTCEIWMERCDLAPHAAAKNMLLSLPWYSVGLCGTCTIGNSMCLLNVNSGPEFQLG